MAETCDEILELFASKRPVFICAPMVRYSKLPFRLLVRKYGCHVAYTPMILADSFHKSQQARDNEFTTNPEDRPLIVQFAASNAVDFSLATQLVYNHCDGVDLNCGCPQRWAQHQGVGCCLMRQPQLVADMVRHVRNCLPDAATAASSAGFSVSVKIRLLDTVRETVEACRRLEAAGVTAITVHARTGRQRASHPADMHAVAHVVDAVRVPVVANGDVTSRQQAEQVARDTGAAGVMCARGMLHNPAMFSDGEAVSAQCVSDWVRLCVATGGSFSTLHHHLIYMLEHSLPRALRRSFNMLNSQPAVLDFLRQHLDVQL